MKGRKPLIKFWKIIYVEINFLLLISLNVIKLHNSKLFGKVIITNLKLNSLSKRETHFQCQKMKNLWHLIVKNLINQQHILKVYLKKLMKSEKCLVLLKILMSMKIILGLT